MQMRSSKTLWIRNLVVRVCFTVTEKKEMRDTRNAKWQGRTRDTRQERQEVGRAWGQRSGGHRHLS